MTAKDKAIELVDKSMGIIIFQIKQNIESDTIQASKSLAINTVDEVFKSIRWSSDFNNEQKNYWNEVKQEIEKL